MSGVAAQAAAVIAADYQARYSGCEWGPFRAATALADAGLLRPEWATDDLATIRQALAFLADARLVDICGYLDLTISEAEALRPRCIAVLARCEDPT